MTTITKRIGASASADNTKRVAYNGTVDPSYADTWSGAWGNAWGNTWSLITFGVAASPAVDATKRVSEAAATSITKRVTGV